MDAVAAVAATGTARGGGVQYSMSMLKGFFIDPFVDLFKGLEAQLRALLVALGGQRSHAELASQRIVGVVLGRVLDPLLGLGGLVTGQQQVHAVPQQHVTERPAQLGQ